MQEINWDKRGVRPRPGNVGKQEHTILPVLEARERLQARGVDGPEGLSRRCHCGGHCVIAPFGNEGSSLRETGRQSDPDHELHFED